MVTTEPLGIVDPPDGSVRATVPRGLWESVEPPMIGVKPACSRVLSADPMLMPDTDGTVTRMPLTFADVGGTKSTESKRLWIACIASAHIGPANPDPDTS